MTTVVDSSVTVSDLVAAVRRQQLPAIRQEPSPSISRQVRDVWVIAAHPGAGASSIAVSMLDALVACGEANATLVDLASPDESGLLGAAEREVESSRPEWRSGRRGTARILRRSTSLVPTTDWPVDETGRTIFDGGPLHRGLPVVVVCRATLPSIRRAEAAIAACPEGPVVAVVAANRWPRTIVASLGPGLASAADAHRVVFVPHRRVLELNGVDAEPLPAKVLAAGVRLVELTWPDLAGSSSPHRQKGIRR